MLLRRVAILLLLIVFVQNAFAQQQKSITVKRFPVKNLGYEDGLLDNNINSIATDANGFTWISTFTGLQRYNGYKLVTLNPVIGNDTFNINYPVYLFGLKDGSILISIKNGLLKYDVHTNTFKLLINFITNSALHFGIVPLKETAQGLWCMQQNKGIVLYTNNGKFISAFSFFNKNIIDEILHTDNILYEQIFASNNNCIYILNQRKELLYINTKYKAGAVFKPEYNEFSTVAALYNKLFLVENGALFITDENGFSNKQIIHFDSTETATGYSLSAADSNHLFLTRNNHLYSIDTAGNIQYQLTDRNKKDFVTNGNIAKVYADKFNRTWILSNNDIKRVENKELLFQNFFYAGNQSNFIRALYYDTAKNILLAAGYNGMIQAYDTLANTLWHQPVITKASEYLLNIEKLTANEYLVIPFYAAPFIFNIQTKQNYPLVGPANFQNMQANYPCNLKRINDSTIFIASNSTVFKCIFKNDKLIAAQPLINFIHDNKLTCFLLGVNKKLWVGTASGLLYIVDKNNVKRVDGLGNFTIRSMAEDSAHKIYIGTEKGLFVYDDNGVLLKKYNIASGLRNDCIYAIGIANNICFVSTNLGITSISANGVIHNYSKEMGLQENEFNTNAVLKTKNGKLFFGGINGITAFYPSALMQVKDTPQIHITDLVVNDVSQNSSQGIWFGDAVKLNYKQNRLRFDIAAMGMLNVNEYVYQYRMGNLDSAWQTTYQPTNINYTLQPGNYTLEIKCHSLLSSGEAFAKNFSIIITPPFWQTWWFRTIAVVCAAAAVYFAVYRYNKNKYLKKIRLLETQQQIQTERERISREMHDNIGAQLSFIIGNVDLAIDNTSQTILPQEQQRLQLINTTARNVMNNLRESIWALNKEKITLEEFADKLKEYIQQVIELKPGLAFISQENIKSNITFSPTETLNIFRICQEVINNIIKHANASCLKIFIASDNTQKFSILIEDNGKGFTMQQNFNGHYGLQNMQHRAAELNLNLKIESKPGQGTIVSIHK